jgi:hypothetical protein
MVIAIDVRLLVMFIVLLGFLANRIPFEGE